MEAKIHQEWRTAINIVHICKYGAKDGKINARNLTGSNSEYFMHHISALAGIRI